MCEHASERIGEAEGGGVVSGHLGLAETEVSLRAS